jgi:hypothetical protein
MLRRHPTHIFLENKYSQLLVAQIALLVVPTLINPEQLGVMLSIILVTVVVALTLRIFQVGLRVLLVATIAVLCMGILELWLLLSHVSLHHSRFTLLLINAGHIAVVGVAALSILRRIFQTDMISGDSIRGGVCVYFMMGYVFYFAYRTIYSFDPGSFDIPKDYDSVFSLLYFSFTTLTTVGYGDITPDIPVTMAIANLESITGQMYTAIVMARLVSQYLNSRLRRSG